MRTTLLEVAACRHMLMKTFGPDKSLSICAYFSRIVRTASEMLFTNLTIEAQESSLLLYIRLHQTFLSHTAIDQRILAIPSALASISFESVD